MILTISQTIVYLYCIQGQLTTNCNSVEQSNNKYKECLQENEILVAKLDTYRLQEESLLEKHNERETHVEQLEKCVDEKSAVIVQLESQIKELKCDVEKLLDTSDTCTKE